MPSVCVRHAVGGQQLRHRLLWWQPAVHEAQTAAPPPAPQPLNCEPQPCAGTCLPPPSLPTVYVQRACWTGPWSLDPGPCGHLSGRCTRMHCKPFARPMQSISQQWHAPMQAARFLHSSCLGCQYIPCMQVRSHISGMVRGDAWRGGRLHPWPRPAWSYHTHSPRATPSHRCDAPLPCGPDITCSNNNYKGAGSCCFCGSQLLQGHHPCLR